MAGAGYKLFNTGDVLTAAQVNTYLMEQTVMVFANAAARTTALSGVVSEGMISYLKDTNAVEVYDGSNWVSSDDPNAIQNSIVDAKGDLITATAADTPARLAVGSNGETLVADSAATTGLRWQGNYAAGKNKIINGDFSINQRGFTSTTTNGAYGFDRFSLGASDGTVTYSTQAFTAGTAPVVGYEAINFARIDVTGQTAAGAIAILRQRVEDVRTLANQTATISFWAKAASGTPKIAIEAEQNFGSGGSSAVQTLFGQVTLTTSWVRYSVTATVPSVSGKTIGSSSYLQLNLWTSAGTSWNSRTNSLGIQTNTFDIWGVQVEAGNVATAFQTATGTLAGELAAAQRYYWRCTANGTQPLGWAQPYSSTKASGFITVPVPLRATASTLDFSGMQITRGGTGSSAITAMSGSYQTNSNGIGLDITVASGLTAGELRGIELVTASTSYFGISAEL